jgi:hypothetical protein
VLAHAVGVTDRSCHPQRLAIISLRRREIAGDPLGFREGRSEVAPTIETVG